MKATQRGIVAPHRRFKPNDLTESLYPNPLNQLIAAFLKTKPEDYAYTHECIPRSRVPLDVRHFDPRQPDRAILRNEPILHTSSQMSAWLQATDGRLRGAESTKRTQSCQNG